MLRREMLKVTLVGSGALASTTNALLPVERAEAKSASESLEALSEKLTKELFSNDGLARPIPKRPTVSDLAKDLDRTLVLVAAESGMSLGTAAFFMGYMTRAST
jgi:NTE family protein